LATAKSKRKPAPKSKKPAVAKPFAKKVTKAKSVKKSPPKAAAKTAKTAKNPVAKKATVKAKAKPKVAPKAKAKPAPKAKVKVVRKEAVKKPATPAKKQAKYVSPAPIARSIKAPVGKARAVPSAIASVAVPTPQARSAGRSVGPVMAMSPINTPVSKTPPKAAPKTTYSEKPSTFKFTPSTVREGGMLSEADIMKQPKSEYMSKHQLAFFRQRLLMLQSQLRENAGATTEHLREISVAPDPADRATLEEEHALELRTRDRERKLLKKIESAIMRIDDGSYGYCEETGEPIGIPRLLARPTATLTIEAQERRELKQKMYGE
jgi:DnaK suppressor protein